MAILWVTSTEAATIHRQSNYDILLRFTISFKVFVSKSIILEFCRERCIWCVLYVPVCVCFCLCVVKKFKKSTFCKDLEKNPK